ncbi:T9SS type A sorting domain-containing protein, partial [bacterium]|nr:T9SS type A sorting domain-containing protein [bacterium]
IQFKLLKKELIEISVYNVLGVKVKELVNRELEKGNYSFKWNAIDQPSGIYFCLFSFNNNSQYKRLLLLK